MICEIVRYTLINHTTKDAKEKNAHLRASPWNRAITFIGGMYVGNYEETTQNGHYRN